MGDYLDRVYFIGYFPNHGKAFCLDRGYNRCLDQEQWKKVKMGDIIEHDMDAFYPQAPYWAHQLKASGARYIALWTNYYE